MFTACDAFNFMRVNLDLVEVSLPEYAFLQLMFC